MKSVQIPSFFWSIFGHSGNKSRGGISKRVFQENKARPIFRKNEHFLPPDTHTYVSVLGGKKCSLLGKLVVLWFLETPVLPYFRQHLHGEFQPGIFKKLL